METKFAFALLTPAISFFFCFVFLRLWSKHRQEWHILGFGVSFLLGGTGITYIGIIAPGFTLGHALVFHLLCNLGMTQLNWSIAKRLGVRAPIPEMLGIAWVSGLLLVVAAVVSDDAFYRIYAIEAAIGLQFAIGMWSTRKARKSHANTAPTIPSYQVPMLLLLLTPPAIYAYEGAVKPELYSDSIHWMAVMLLAPLSIVMMSTNTLLALYEDLTLQVKRAHQTDYLTGLPTRQAFEEHAEKLFDEADEQSMPVSVILADIDDFKNVNDTLGHHSGDAVIAAFGTLLRTHVEDRHLVGRVGGEEFCIVLRQTEERTAQMLARQLCLQFNMMQVEDCPEDRRFSASFGVAGRCAPETQTAVYTRADRALYAAKSAGKNQVISQSIMDGANDIGRDWQAA
ncbi:MAG: GGDEF domain-containing protein [Pseudomonadota bacterium]